MKKLLKSTIVLVALLGLIGCGGGGGGGNPPGSTAGCADWDWDDAEAFAMAQMLPNALNDDSSIFAAPYSINKKMSAEALTYIPDTQQEFDRYEEYIKNTGGFSVANDGNTDCFYDGSLRYFKNQMIFVAPLGIACADAKNGRIYLSKNNSSMALYRIGSGGGDNDFIGLHGREESVGIKTSYVDDSIWDTYDYSSFEDLMDSMQSLLVYHGYTCQSRWNCVKQTSDPCGTAQYTTTWHAQDGVGDLRYAIIERIRHGFAPEP